MASTPAASANAPARPLQGHDALPAGTRFGELEILRVLGAGGFGIVYLARDHALQRHVALKEYMPSSLAGRGEGQMVSLRSGSLGETYALGLRSFVNEARLLAQFNHPSLVKVYRFWEENGTAYMVMPYLQGRTLRETRHAMGAQPTEAWIRSLMRPLLDALELLHREGVYHRDIAPDNILLPPGEPPVLLDFGAARRAIGDHTQTFTAIVKPSYAPIEQYSDLGQQRQGPWTDLYALGAVVYYLLRGTPPPPATARAAHDDGPLLAGAENPQVSAPFLAAMERALAVRPADRPQSVAALRQAMAGHAGMPPAVQAGATMYEHSPTMPAARDLAFSPTLPMADGLTFAPTLPLEAHPAAAVPAPTASARPTTVAPAPAEPPPALRSVIAAPEASAIITPMPARPPAQAPALRDSRARSAAASAQPAPRRGLWIGAGALAVVTVAVAAWVMGNRSALSAAATAQTRQQAASAALAAAPQPEAPSAPRVAAAAPAVQAAAASAVPVSAVTVPTPQPAAPPRTQAPKRAALSAVGGVAPHGGELRPQPSSPHPVATPNANDARPNEHAASPAPLVRAPGAAAAPALLLPSSDAHPMPAALPSGPASPREACGRRVFLAFAACMEQQCETPRFEAHPQCARVRDIVEERRKRLANGGGDGSGGDGSSGGDAGD